jgi:CrcB protein
VSDDLPAGSGADDHVGVPPQDLTDELAVDPDPGAAGAEHAVPPPWSHRLAAVALGGMAGALARYALTLATPAPGAGFPWTTFGINVAGCAAIGLLVSVLAAHPEANPLIRLLLGTGVLGGFTTFSTYAVDAGRLALAHRPGIALAYLAGTLVAALLAVVVGETAGHAITRRGGSR